MKKIWEIITIITWSIATVLVLYVVFLALFPINVIDFKNTTQLVLNPHHEVQVGEKIVMQIDYCKTFPFKATVDTHLEDSVVYDLAETKSNFETGCRVVLQEFTVPKVIVPGEKVRIKQTMNYKTSPFTYSTEVIYSEWVTVIK